MGRVGIGNGRVQAWAKALVSSFVKQMPAELFMMLPVCSPSPNKEPKKAFHQLVGGLGRPDPPTAPTQAGSLSDLHTQLLKELSG